MPGRPPRTRKRGIVRTSPGWFRVALHEQKLALVLVRFSLILADVGFAFPFALPCVRVPHKAEPYSTDPRFPSERQQHAIARKSRTSRCVCLLLLPPSPTGLRYSNRTPLLGSLQHACLNPVVFLRAGQGVGNTAPHHHEPRTESHEDGTEEDHGTLAQPTARGRGKRHRSGLRAPRLGGGSGPGPDTRYSASLTLIVTDWAPPPPALPAPAQRPEEARSTPAAAPPQSRFGSGRAPGGLERSRRW